ncbi:pyridoxal reductase [Schizosaccharomyces japonicus yFS275]|uniref:Pyridoxal reductase n=1 Tax=Schizosaccharomyces japonicus (strain yFS275 / FY16936) TaxID=402676 RepID=B6JY84_SCHJY|nr:pyridoxal reductase [Schizosaccharomyces japonicus yFS275]EEB06502.1 pyridoxal reductase [Schizosaccharomyces japonicus yFS275]
MQTIKVNGKEIGTFGLGLMGLTWRQNVIPDEQAFELLNYAISRGVNFWNAGEFYGIDPIEANLDLLARYFTKYPENADKVFISVKGATDPQTLGPCGDRASVTKSVNNVLKHLRGVKKLDLFECARVDARVPIEETMQVLKEFVDEGKIGCIGLSEASASSIRKANSILPIAMVETEYSMWSLDIEQNGILKACAELNIPIVAYSPFASGFLTGTIKTEEDLKRAAESQNKTMLDRFKPENFRKNKVCLDALEALAASFSMTLSQLALSFVLSNKEAAFVPIPGCTTAARLKSNLDTLDHLLSEEQYQKVRDTLDQHPIHGKRYNEQLDKYLAI